MPAEQPVLPLSPVRNRALFSSHWLENRLPLEPEWTNLRSDAEAVLESLVELWNVESDRVERYGDEAGMDYAFI